MAEKPALHSSLKPSLGSRSSSSSCGFSTVSGGSTIPPSSSLSAGGGHTTAAMSNDMYRVGDYVYFEVHAGQPYQIRKIEELSRTSNGAQVEVKVQCFYRRRDMPPSLINMADKHYAYLEEENEIQSTDNMDDETKHQLRHRELFLSRQSETVPAQYIRGKCSVHLLSEVESMSSYLVNGDQFFYTLVFDPVHKSLQADRGEMRVGARFQAEVSSFQKIALDDSYRSEQLAERVWDPESELNESAMDSIVQAVKSVGTLARAVDFNNHVNRPSDSTAPQSYSGNPKDPGLLTTACSASRDASLHFAYNHVNKHNYDVTQVMLNLISESGGLTLVRDEMERWSVYEANLFEEALDKIGKDFAQIREQTFPWKTLESIIEYYYMWKTTDRYMRQKRLKAADVDQRLKQVYIPSDSSVNNPNKTTAQTANRVICEGCETDEAGSWFLWGPNNQCRLCGNCWVYWKKYGGLIKPNFYEGNIISSNTSAETAKYECRSCGKLFNRQERLINHMTTHGEYCCTVGQCEKEFKSRNQLHRHLATVHHLVLTKKDTYVQAIKSRSCFMLVTTPLSKLSRDFCDIPIIRLARKPCIDFDQEVCQKRTMDKFDIEKVKDLCKKKRSRSKGIKVTAQIIKAIREYAKNLAENDSTTTQESTSQLKRKLPNVSLPICSTKVKRINWLEQPDGIIYIQTEKTLKLRNLLPLPQQRKCGRRPCVLAMPDMGRG